MKRFTTRLILALTIHVTALAAEPRMTAHFIDVGQAAATLLEFPCGAVLIDAGAQDSAYADKLVEYLTKVFEARPDLNETLEAIFITHPHKDHTLALKPVVEHFTVKRVIEDGLNHGSGFPQMKWLRNEAPNKHINIRTVLNSEVMHNGNKSGITDADIDPIHCNDCDPKIVILSGQWDQNPGWPPSEFTGNENLHSLVIRVDFGDSAFLFTGDLEDRAIGSFLKYYQGQAPTPPPILDVDVWQIGHHGSSNGTTDGILKAMTPTIAVASVGHWDFGAPTTTGLTTFAYGHPRKAALDLLSTAIPGKRSGAVWIQAGTGKGKFSQYVVRKKIYATAWDGNTKVLAGMHHDYTVTRKN